MRQAADAARRLRVAEGNPTGIASGRGRDAAPGHPEVPLAHGCGARCACMPSRGSLLQPPRIPHRQRSAYNSSLPGIRLPAPQRRRPAGAPAAGAEGGIPSPGYSPQVWEWACPWNQPLWYADLAELVNPKRSFFLTVSLFPFSFPLPANSLQDKKSRMAFQPSGDKIWDLPFIQPQEPPLPWPLPQRREPPL